VSDGAHSRQRDRCKATIPSKTVAHQSGALWETHPPGLPRRSMPPLAVLGRVPSSEGLIENRELESLILFSDGRLPQQPPEGCQ
jgi:hypothetical protein